MSRKCVLRQPLLISSEVQIGNPPTYSFFANEKVKTAFTLLFSLRLEKLYEAERPFKTSFDSANMIPKLETFRNV